MTDLITIDAVRNFSYTRCAADEECRRKRYLSREWGGTGLQPIHAGWALVHGNIVHKALEDLGKTGSIDFAKYREKTQTEALASGMDIHKSRDWAALVEGALRGFVRAVWPQLMSEYEIIGTEKWIQYDLPNGFRFRARQDLLLKNKFDGHVLLIDYKNTSSTKPQWIASWSKSVQLHSSMYALKQSEGIDVQRAMVIGLYKGYKNDKKHIQQSAFNYGYVNREFSMSPQYSYEYQRSKGWEQFSTFEEFDDLSAWIGNMPAETLAEQFPQTGPIFIREDIAETWFRQQLIREAEVDEGVQLLHSSTSVEEITAILDKYFKQNFSHCEPAYGYSCEFSPLCWQPWVGSDPLGSNLFIRYKEELEID